MTKSLWTRLAKSISQLGKMAQVTVKTSKCNLPYLALTSMSGNNYVVFHSPSLDMFELRNQNKEIPMSLSFDSEFNLFGWLMNNDLDSFANDYISKKKELYQYTEENLLQEFTAFAKQLMSIPQVSDTFVIQREGGGKPICGMTTKSGKGYGITWHKKYKNYRVFNGLGKYLDYKDQVVFSYSSLNELYEWLQTHDIDEEVSNAIPGQNLPCERSYDREAYEIAYGKPKRIKEG